MAEGSAVHLTFLADADSETSSAGFEQGRSNLVPCRGYNGAGSSIIGQLLRSRGSARALLESRNIPLSKELVLLRLCPEHTCCFRTSKSNRLMEPFAVVASPVTDRIVVAEGR